jgi:hypothetical protein
VDYDDLVRRVIEGAVQAAGSNAKLVDFLVIELGDARRLGGTQPGPYSRNAITNWRHGHNHPPVKVFLACAKRAGMSLDDLLGIEDSERDQVIRTMRDTSRLLQRVEKLIRSPDGDGVAGSGQQPRRRSVKVVG